MRTSLIAAAFFCILTLSMHAGEPLRVGIIGCDTSHVTEFTKILNAPDNKGDLAGIKVVAAFPGGSEDIPSSKDRLAGFVDKLKGMNVEIVDSIDALIGKVDVVLLESVDGRPHLQQVLPVLKAKKPVFVDKPAGGTLADVVEIFRVAKELNVPCFSSSSLRYNPVIVALKSDTAPPEVPGAKKVEMKTRQDLGDIVGCDTYGPCSLDPHHPDLFWYGIHTAETLYTLMGPGCESVTRVATKDCDVVVGVWKDGRVGTFRGNRGGNYYNYGTTVYGTKATLNTTGSGGYQPLLVEIAKFFKSGVAPVSAEETIEIYAFMEAADESKRQGGKPVKLETVLLAAKKK